MYLLYLDDSGSPDNKNEQYFVLGGVAVPENSVRWLSHEIEKVALEFSPSGDSRDVEFHATDIFGGRNAPWDKIKEKPDRAKILQKVLRVLDRSYESVVVFACAIHKESSSGMNPLHLAYEQLSSRFDMFLARKKDRGLIVLDKSSHEINIQDKAKSIRRDGNQWGKYDSSIIEVPMFVDSKSSRIIQLADHIAYAVFRRYNSDDLNYFKCIEGRFDQRDGKIFGLMHYQTNNPRCTCPACLTKNR